jgi:hypothetical protein
MFSAPKFREILSKASSAAVRMAGLALLGAGLASHASTITFPNAYTYGGMAATTSTMTAVVSNTGSANLTVTGVSITGDFSASVGLPFTVTPGNSVSIVVTFAPTAVGTRTGLFTSTSNDPTNPTVTFNLTGTGVADIAPTVSGSVVTGGIYLTGDTIQVSVTGVSVPGILGEIGLTAQAPNATQIGPVYYQPGGGSPSLTNVWNVTLNGGPGTYTFLAFAQDTAGLNSGWVTIATITVLPATYNAQVQSFSMPAPGLEIWFSPSPIATGTYTIQRHH